MALPTVLVSVTGDPLNIGHLNLIESACAYGAVTVGVIRDEACQGHRQMPAQSTEQRVQIFRSLRNVSRVVEQLDWSYATLISELRPDFFVHSNNWDFSCGKDVRSETIRALESYGGKLVEVEHSDDVPYDIAQTKSHFLPEARRGALASLLNSGRCLTFVESHSPMSALIVEKHRRVSGAHSHDDMAVTGFDGLWSSSLTDSTLRGVPDTEKLDFSQRMSNVSEMFRVSSLPLIFDADTGGHTEHLIDNIKTMESLGISACILEDKTGLKRNSLYGNDVHQTQEDVAVFSKKLENAVSARSTGNFLVFARIESLILDKGLRDAEARAASYIDAGASGIMIHSRNNKNNEITKFIESFKSDHSETPVIVVPTGFGDITVQEFEDMGVSIVIYANHMLRASYSAMTMAAETILKHGRTHELDSRITSIQETLSITG